MKFHRRSASIILWLLMALIISLPSLAIAQSSKLTLAAYNTQWLLDVFDDPYTSDEGIKPKPREELVALAKALRAVNADVVGLSELENEGVLKAFVAELLPDMGYQYVAAQPTNSDRGQNLGILSRYPIEKLISYRLSPVLQEHSIPGEPLSTKNMARDLCHAQIRGPGNRLLHVMVVHFKSKNDRAGDPQSEQWRTAEARFTRQQISNILADDPQALIAVMGDFNDLPDSKPINILLDRHNKLPKLLLDAHRDMPMEQRITYLKKPYRNAGPIDYILLSPALDKFRQPSSAKVLDDPTLLAGSDHAPVYVTLDFKD